MKHNKIKIQFKFKTYHQYNFKNLTSKILKKLNGLAILHTGFVSLPIRRYRFTVIRSPHVDKKSREQFETKIYTKSFIAFFDKECSIEKEKAKFLITYIKNSCAGCSLKVYYEV